MFLKVTEIITFYETSCQSCFYPLSYKVLNDIGAQKVSTNSVREYFAEKQLFPTKVQYQYVHNE